MVRTLAVLLSAALVGCDPTLVVGREGGVMAGGTGGLEPSAGGAAAGPSDAAGGAGAGAGGAGDGLLWFADHRAGTLDEWTSGGATEGGQYGPSGAFEVTGAPARSGNHAVKITIDTDIEGARVARLYRAIVDEPAYYSAWFLLEQDHSIDGWWSIFLFRGHDDPADTDTAYYLWELHLARSAEGNLTLSFYDQQARRTTFAAPGTEIAVGQWQHIEAFLHYASPDATEIRYWLNGELVLEVSGLSDPPSPWLFWSVGNGARDLSPPVSTLYLDDAAISLTRRGP